jgi:hypothetical protein
MRVINSDRKTLTQICLSPKLSTINMKRLIDDKILNIVKEFGENRAQFWRWNIGDLGGM